jgi:hypothetical protein
VEAGQGGARSLPALSGRTAPLHPPGLTPLPTELEREPRFRVGPVFPRTPWERHHPERPWESGRSFHGGPVSASECRGTRSRFPSQLPVGGRIRGKAIACCEASPLGPIRGWSEGVDPLQMVLVRWFWSPSPDTRSGAVLACLPALEVEADEGHWKARPLYLGPPPWRWGRWWPLPAIPMGRAPSSRSRADFFAGAPARRGGKGPGFPPRASHR